MSSLQQQFENFKTQNPTYGGFEYWLENLHPMSTYKRIWVSDEDLVSGQLAVLCNQKDAAMESNYLKDFLVQRRADIIARHKSMREKDIDYLDNMIKGLSEEG